MPDDLIKLSRLYGANPDYVLAGGGNTSWKDSDTLYVKASGFSLAEAAPESFVAMDRKAMAGIWEKTYPAPDLSDPFGSKRESAVLVDMLSARRGGDKRPSVETLLHDIMPFAYVVHLHPALVNGLTCSKRGELAAREIFGADIIWIPSVNPGYTLSVQVKNAQDQYRAQCGKSAQIIFLQNHGVFVGDDTADGIQSLYSAIMSKIGAKITRKPDFSMGIRDQGSGIRDQGSGSRDSSFDERKKEIMSTLTANVGAAGFMCNSEIDALVQSRSAFAPVSSAFTPDHIVYSGSDPLFTEALEADDIIRDWENQARLTGGKAKIIAVRGMGVFSAAGSAKVAALALDLFKDTIKVAVYAESFGGPLFMARDKIDFINNWEVERFRSAVSAK